VRDMSFSYPAPPMTPNPQVLTKVDVDIQAGERVAILGRIGSGKSTLLRVMAGLYQPVSGQVLADGVDISQIDPGDWRSSIGFVGQDVRLFYGSLRDNVMMSRQAATTEQFLQVARMTGLDRLAAAHPLGFDLQVGEMGQALSGGQRQLVGLARCLLARPRVLLMDEPTSAMDGQTESLFMQQLVGSLQGRTFVLVTHRLALLELVERVIVIDGGRVVADGPKAQVLAALGGAPASSNA
jgi:ATP-binding cassette subfamily C protein LapB